MCEYVPSFRRAAQRKADSLGISLEELSRQMKERRKRLDEKEEDHLDPDEVKLFAEGERDRFPVDYVLQRLLHILGCTRCAVQVTLAAPTDSLISRILDRVPMTI